MAWTKQTLLQAGGERARLLGRVPSYREASPFARSAFNAFGGWSAYLDELRKTLPAKPIPAKPRPAPPKPRLEEGPRHFFVPDTQVRPDSNTDHIEAAGNYVLAKRPNVIVIAGDWWDMPSLSSYDSAARKAKDSISVEADIEAGNAAMRRFCKPWESIPDYTPRCEFLEGNHDGSTFGTRRFRYADEHPECRDTIDTSRFHYGPFKRHDFLEIVRIDGIAVSHYYALDSNGRVTNSKRGQASARAQVKNVGVSALAGHKQGLDVAICEGPSGRRIGIIAGSFHPGAYQEYLSPQGNSMWHGIIVCHDVHGGAFDPMFVSADFLLRRYF